MRGMNLTKAKVARRQLGIALALFLEDFDPVSVHTLACAGGELADRLASAKGAMPFSAHALAVVPNLDDKRLKRVRNQFWNAFKHATTRKGVPRSDSGLFKRRNR
jgi:hypothetical protein